MFFKKLHLLNGDVFLLFLCFFVEGIWSFKLQSDLKQQKVLFNSWLVVSVCFRLRGFCLTLCSSIFLYILLLFFHEFLHLEHFRTIVISPVFCVGMRFSNDSIVCSPFFGRAKGRLFRWSIVEPPHWEIKHDLDLPLTQDARMPVAKLLKGIPWLRTKNVVVTGILGGGYISKIYYDKNGNLIIDRKNNIVDITLTWPCISQHSLLLNMCRQKTLNSSWLPELGRGFAQEHSVVPLHIDISDKKSMKSESSP